MVGGTAEVAHLHIGPGCLGLGLVVAAGVEAGLDIHLIAREESAAPIDLPYRAVVKGEGRTTTVELPIVTTCRADTLERLPHSVRDVVLSTPELLVTISAGTVGLQKRHRFLLELAAARQESPETRATIFIPCENDVGNDFDVLARQLDELGVDTRSTMVNRLCPEVYTDEDDQVREVVADELAEWLIEGDSETQTTLSALRQVEFVEFVEDVVPFKTRKRWLVNGAHLALAILAHARPLQSMDEAAAEPGRARWLEGLHSALIEALDQRFPGMEENEQYGRDHVAAWMRHEDEVIRVMKRLKRADPEPFFDDLEAKFIEPISMLGRLERFPEVLYVLNRLHRVLLRASSYVDFDRFSQMLPGLSSTVDLKMADRYRRILAPLVGQDQAEARALSLAASLELHRVRGESSGDPSLN